MAHTYSILYKHPYALGIHSLLFKYLHKHKHSSLCTTLHIGNRIISFIVRIISEILLKYNVYLL